MATQLAAVMPGLGLDPSESKLSISHTCAPPPTPTTASSAAIVLARCHYNQELRLWAAGKLEGNPCSLEAWVSSLAVGWASLEKGELWEELASDFGSHVFPSPRFLPPSLVEESKKNGE